MNEEKYRTEIASLREEIPWFVLASMSPLLYLTHRLITHGFPIPGSNILSNPKELVTNYVVPFALWWILYEQAEGRLSRVKQKVRDFYHSTGSLPFEQYSSLEHFLNATMILFDRTPLYPNSGR